MATHENSGFDVGVNVLGVEPNANDLPKIVTCQFESESI